MKNNGQGFTLIELLVVVLIIGILATVALPQYQKAVARSRLATLKSLVESMADAAEVYYLTNNKYPSRFDELDITIIAQPDSSRESTTSQTFYYSWGNCFISSGNDARVFCTDSQTNTRYRRLLKYNTTSLYPGERTCIALSGNLLANAVCKQDTNDIDPGDVSSGKEYRY